MNQAREDSSSQTHYLMLKMSLTQSTNIYQVPTLGHNLECSKSEVSELESRGQIQPAKQNVPPLC